MYVITPYNRFANLPRVTIQAGTSSTALKKYWKQYGNRQVTPLKITSKVIAC
jgi:mannosyltransferase OCH1-like enzyme